MQAVKADVVKGAARAALSLWGAGDVGQTVGQRDQRAASCCDC